MLARMTRDPDLLMVSQSSARLDGTIATPATQRLYAGPVDEQKRGHNERQRAIGYGVQRAA
jgi:hypothetical protein